MGGKKKGGAHTPYEAPDNLKSNQSLRAIGIVSMGPIKGPVEDNFRSTFFNNTPVQSPDGRFNYKNAEIQYNLGYQDQLPLEGFDYSEREVSVGAEVGQENPITRTVIDNDVTRVRVTVALNALFSQNDKGDTYGSSVDFEILINNRTYRTYQIAGKSSSRFFKSYIIEDLPPRPFTITVKRITPDSTSQRVQNTLGWSSYTEIIDTKLSYPNIAMFGIKLDSRYHNSMPDVTSLLFGREIKIPTTYDPFKRTYKAGIWKGDFKIGWTNNPAWVFYDIVMNDLFGLGGRLGDYGIDKFQLYQIAKYCDQMVPDGYGGQEPRVTLNAWITTQRDAHEILMDIASTFRAMLAWNGTQLTLTQDRPSDPVFSFTQANVVEGKFNRQYAPLKSIFTAVEVEYVDKRNRYQRAIEYVADDDMIRRFGYNVKKITAFGCTSRGQARRFGKWVLETSKLEQCTISFGVGRDGLAVLPGDIIEVMDNSYSGFTHGGRIISFSDRKVVLDRPIDLSSANGKSYLSYINTEKKEVRKEIESVDDDKVSVTLKEVPQDISELTTWALRSSVVKSELYKVLSIAENDDGSFSITALQHEPQKQAIVDNGAVFEPVSTTTHKTGLIPPSSVEINTNSHGINLSFNAPHFTGQGLKYQVKLFKDGKLYEVYDDLKDSSIAFNDLPSGEYIAEIRAKNAHGQLSEAVTKTFNINFDITELVTIPKVFAIGLNWKVPIFANNSSSIEIWTSQDSDFNNARKLVSLAYPTTSYSLDGLGVNESHFFWARMVDNVNGTSGQFTQAVEGRSESSGEKLVNYLQGQVTKNTFSQELAQQITQIETDSTQAKEKVALMETKVNELASLNVDEINQKFNHLVNGNDNILKDSEFTRVNLWGGTNINIHDNSQRVGKRIVNKITKKTSGGHPIGIITHNDNRVTVIERGKQYTLSFFARGNFNSLNKIELKERGSKWQALQAIPLSQTWEKKTLTFTANWNSNNAGVLIAAAPPNQNDWFEIHSVKLEKGTKATDWSEYGDVGLGDLRASVTEASNAVADVNSKLSATYSLKTEVTRGGKKAIAGIALGVGADAQNAESQVIISANKFAIADPNSATLKAPFVVVNEGGQSKVAIAGDLIANGSITGNMIQANASINAPVITGGSISGNSINGATVRGSVIEGGIIRGAHLEGATGKFTGELEVTKIVGGDIIEHVKGRLKRTGTYHDYYYSYTTYGGDKDREESTTVELGIYTAKIHIRSSKVERYIYIGNNEISDILPANISKTYTLERRDKLITRRNDYSIASAPLDFLVMAYAVSSNATITVL
ncbi:phage tail protein [Pasteurella sp. PK-2025]|uniref:phage tail protein n=1 Tax=Pasteurella sp. PK-2025 TaxID=3413133 RepID=UPI003C72347B